MRIPYIFATILFFIGLFFKLMHWDGAGPMLIVSLGILATLSVIQFIIIFKSNKSGALLYLAFAFQCFYFLFRIMFWGGIFPFMILMMASSVLFWGYVMAKKIPFRPAFRWMTVSTFLCFILLFTYSHYVFYLLSFGIFPNITYDQHEKLDTYSWHLYLAGEREKAIAANEGAMKALQKQIASGKNPEFKDLWLKAIEDHKGQIENGTWEEYHRPMR